MTIGNHECKQALNTSLVQAVAIGVDEALTSLEESFYDLADDQLQAFPIEGRNNIAWMVMHALQNLDKYTNVAHGGAPIFEHQWRWSLWDDNQRPKPGDSFPARDRMIGWLHALRTEAEKVLARTDKTYLASKPGGDWPGSVADMYMRTIFHTASHVRQIWALRGLLGQVSTRTWPRQHWA